MTKRGNLIGKTFGYLTVVGGYLDKEKSEMKWVCKCNCGNEKNIIARGIDLKSGHVKSCSCFKARRLAYGESAFNRLYNTYERRARQKGFAFELTKSEFKDITSRPCFYCGIEPKQVTSKGNGRAYGTYIYNGIDRVDPRRGYEKDNIVSCCGQCNVAKNDYSYEEFIEWIGRLVRNLSIDENLYKELENLKL